MCCCVVPSYCVFPGCSVVVVSSDCSFSSVGDGVVVVVVTSDCSGSVAVGVVVVPSDCVFSGCSVVVKAHYMHSGTAELVSSAIIKSVKKTGMPNGVFSNINGGIEVGQNLVKNLKIKAYKFPQV